MGRSTPLSAQEEKKEGKLGFGEGGEEEEEKNKRRGRWKEEQGQRPQPWSLFMWIKKGETKKRKKR